MFSDTLQSVLATDSLDRGASRSPDYRAENEALRELMDTLADAPERVLQRLAEVVMALCGAQSGGLSVEEDGPDGRRVFRWWAAAGVAAPFRNATMPCDASPCGLVVETAKPQLLVRPARAYPALAAVDPPVESTLIAPFFDGGKPAGTLWIIDHGGGSRPFDAEDARLLESLAGFATIAWRAAADRRAVEENDALLGLVTDRLPVRIAYVDRECRFRFMNDAYEREVGIRRETSLGRTVAEVMGRAMFDRVRPYYERAFAGETHTQEFEAPYPMGNRWIRVTYVPDLDAEGEARGVVLQVVDVTEQRRSEAVRREREADLRAILNASAGGFYGVDAEGRTTSGNPAFLSMLGIERIEDVLGQKLHGVIHHSRPDGSPYPVEDCPIYCAASGGTPAHVVDELFFRVDDGTSFPVEYWTQPIVVDGEVRGAVTTFLDITDRKAAEAALLTSEEHYRSLFESIDDGFCTFEMIFDVTGKCVDYRFLDVNEAFVEQTGLRKEDVLGGKTIRQLVPTHEQHWFDTYGRVALTGESIRFENRAEGLGRWYEAHAFRIGGEGSHEVGALFKDISARRAAEAEREHLVAALTVERERLQSLFRMSPSAIAVIRGEDLRFEYANDAYFEVVGRNDIVGKTLLDALPEMADQGFPELLRGVMATGEPFYHAETPVLLRPKTDEPSRTIYVNLLYQAIVEADGTTSGVFVHAVDVTAQVLARREVASLNDALERRVAERTEQLEAAVQEAEGFNYSISHDLRTPLRAMVATSSILLEEIGDELEEEHRELLQRQAHNANRMGVLIDELLRLSRFARVAVRRERLDMTEKSRAVFDELAAHERCHGCRFEVQEGMVAEGDEGLVRTVLHNLLGNACKFSPDGGTIRVRQEGDVFSVADEGVGFEMRYAQKIFLPFERLVSEAQFEGTGIGLANVKRIVERHGGRVWVESEPGKGTTFFFTLG